MNLSNDLLEIAGYQDARFVRNLDVLLYQSCNIGELIYWSLRRLEVLHHTGFACAAMTDSGLRPKR